VATIAGTVPTTQLPISRLDGSLEMGYFIILNLSNNFGFTILCFTTQDLHRQVETKFGHSDVDLFVSKGYIDTGPKKLRNFVFPKTFLCFRVRVSGNTVSVKRHFRQVS